MNEKTHNPKLPTTTLVQVEWTLPHGQPDSVGGWRKEPLMTLAEAKTGGHLSSGHGGRSVQVRIADGPWQGRQILIRGNGFYAAVELYSDGSVCEH